MTYPFRYEPRCRAVMVSAAVALSLSHILVSLGQIDERHGVYLVFVLSFFPTIISLLTSPLSSCPGDPYPVYVYRLDKRCLEPC